MEPLIKLYHMHPTCEVYKLTEYLIIKSAEILDADAQDLSIKFKCFNDYRNGFSGEFPLTRKNTCDKKIILNKCIPLTPDFNNVSLNAVSASNGEFEVILELYLNR